MAAEGRTVFVSSHMMAEMENTTDPAMESEVWAEDWSWLADNLITRIASAPADTAVFAVSDEATGRVVSAAWLVFYPGTEFAGLWGGSTLAA